MGRSVGLHWFRHGLRIHDNPALTDLVTSCDVIHLWFNFDGETADTYSIGYNRLAFLLECLQDLDQQLIARGGQLIVTRGRPVEVLRYFLAEHGITHLSFEQDPEPIWKPRDAAVRAWCDQERVEVIERISHTLWDPEEVIKANDGQPPLTFSMFHQVAMSIGLPPLPISTPPFFSDRLGTFDLHQPHPHPVEVFPTVPEVADIEPLKPPSGEHQKRYIGGETQAQNLLAERIAVEEASLNRGIVMPNQYCPDLLGAPLSLSAYLRYGCISVRGMYHRIQSAFQATTVQDEHSLSICLQLVWREFFYTMAVHNINYDKMEENPICLNINWRTDKQQLNTWREGKTGYPFIDAAMRQLVQEGWIHHVARNACSCFLTRGDLWLNWVDGLRIFNYYLLDSDWSVSAGNWMWVSSSAFEKLLDSSDIVSPVIYGRVFEPTGEYIRRYVPELRGMPTKYVFSPWEAPLEVQQSVGCVVGTDYPVRMVDHAVASQHNSKKMEAIAMQLGMQPPPHLMPSGQEEVKYFFGLPSDDSDRVNEDRRLSN